MFDTTVIVLICWVLYIALKVCILETVLFLSSSKGRFNSRAIVLATPQIRIPLAWRWKQNHGILRIKIRDG
jgi:hypothetical protein